MSNLEATAQEYDAISLTSTSTNSGYKNATRVFDIFAEKQGYPVANDLTESFVYGEPRNLEDPPIRKVLAEFCNFLRDTSKKGNTFYKPDTQLQYLSGMKTVFVRKFKDLGANPDWYQHLSTALKLRGRVDAMERGE
ncbi:MAG: hypothetical protein ACREBR_01580, partial [bacterium]